MQLSCRYEELVCIANQAGLPCPTKANYDELALYISQPKRYTNLISFIGVDNKNGSLSKRTANLSTDTTNYIYHTNREGDIANKRVALPTALVLPAILHAAAAVSVTKTISVPLVVAELEQHFWVCSINRKWSITKHCVEDVIAKLTDGGKAACDVIVMYYRHSPSCSSRRCSRFGII